MATTAYATLAELKVRLENDADEPAQDDALDRVLLAASRTIDGLTSDIFYPLTAATLTLDADDSGTLVLAPSLRSVTSIATDDNGTRTYATVWAPTDYDLEPANAVLYGQPYTALRLPPNGRYQFPRGRRTVRIVGDWGWASVPTPVREACLVLAHRLVKRPDAALGVVAATTIDGAAIPLRAGDPDVAALLAPYRRRVVLAV